PGEAIGNAACLGFGLAKADSSQFGVGKHAKGNLPSRADAMTACKIIPNDSKIIEGDVSEVWTARAVAHGPDALCCRLEPLIDFDVTTIRDYDSGQLQADTVSVGSSAGRDQNMRAFQAFFRSGLDNSKFNQRTGLPLNTRDLGAHQQVDSF